MTNEIKEGLEGVVAARTRLSGIDGEKGRLWLAGFSLEKLASNAHFEEMAYLLWHGQLPDREQLEAFRSRLSSWSLPEYPQALIEAAVRAGQKPIDVLRLALDSLRLEEADVALWVPPPLSSLPRGGC